MFKKIMNFLYHYRILNPIYRLILSNISCVPELNNIKRTTQIVVSLSSEENNFDKLQYTLYSVFNQKIGADKVILWLSDKCELSALPYSITKFVKSGLDIRFVEYAGSYTKIIYALKEYNDSIIVTADSGIYYPRNWLQKLYHSYISNPDDIHVHNAAEVPCEKNKIHSINEWRFFVNSETSRYSYYPIDLGGVLYPPFCFKNDILREDIYKKKIDVPWTIWSWIMSIVSNRKVRLVKNHIRSFACTNIIDSYKKYSYVLKDSAWTDEKIKTMLEFYGKNIYSNINNE